MNPFNDVVCLRTSKILKIDQASRRIEKIIRKRKYRSSPNCWSYPGLVHEIYKVDSECWHEIWKQVLVHFWKKCRCEWFLSLRTVRPYIPIINLEILDCVFKDLYLLQGTGQWRCRSLIMIHLNDYPLRKYLYTALAVTSQLYGESQRPLLSQIYLENTKNQIFLYPYCIPLRTNNIDHLNIYIKDKNGEDPAFFTGESTVTLIFQQM